MLLKTNFLFAIVLIFNYIAIAQKCDSTAFEEAIRFQRKGQMQKAIDWHSKQLKRCEMTEAYLNRGFSYYDLEAFPKAEKDFENAIRISKDPLETRTQIGDYYMHIKDFKKAYQTFESLTKTNPNYAPAYFKMGRALWKPVVDVLVNEKPEDSTKNLTKYRNLMDSVEQCYDKALALDSTEYDFWYMRGDFKLAKYAYESALADFKKAVELKPFRENAIQSAGFCCHSLGRKKEACELFTRWSLLIDPSNPSLFWRKKEWSEKYCKENAEH